MSLEVMLNHVKKARGIQRVAAIRELRAFLKGMPKARVIAQILMIKEPELLRLLWSAGLDADLQHAVMKRLEEIT